MISPSSVRVSTATAASVNAALFKGKREKKNAISLSKEIGEKLGCNVIFDFDEESSSSTTTFSCTAKLSGLTMKGNGPNKKEAKTKAAEKLLEQIEFLLNLAVSASPSPPHLDRPPSSKLKSSPPAIAAIVRGLLVKGKEEDKNAISLLKEIGEKLSCHPSYDFEDDVSSATKTFSCIARLSDLKTEAKGSSKKEAKATAAKKLLESVETTFLPFSYLDRPTSFQEACEDSEFSNTIGQLQELTDKLGYSKPEYTLVEEEGQPPDKSFIMHVKVSELGVITEGRSRTKKDAKKMAATRMLEILEYKKSSVGHTSGWSLIAFPEHLRRFFRSHDDVYDREMFRSTKADSVFGEIGPVTDTSGKSSQYSPNTRAIQTLKSFVDEKRVKLKYFYLPVDKMDDTTNYCMVKIYTDPPIVIHGMGTSLDVARENAAQNALRHIYR